MTVQEYDFSIKQIPGKQQIVDCFSRLFKIDQDVDDELDALEEYIAYVASLAPLDGVTIEEIQQATNEDEEMRQIKIALDTGVWPQGLLRFQNVRDELCWIENVLLRELRIVILATLRTRIINLLHEGHPGIVKTVAAARERV